MLSKLENKKIFLASEPVDFRMSIDRLSELIKNTGNNYLHDGSIYVFYNHKREKIKCLFWDKNGFVLYYKKLLDCKFNIVNKKMLTMSDLHDLLDGVNVKKLSQDV